MGKALLLIVTAAAIGGGIMALQTQETEFHTAGQIAEADAEFLAREAARSGYEVGMSDVALAYAGRPARTGIDAEVGGMPQGGSYDLSVVEQSDATLSVTSTGQARFINTQHDPETRRYRMQGNLARIGQAPSAVVVRALEVVPNITGNTFMVSGQDRRPGGAMTTGAGSDAFGVLAVGPGLADLFISGLSNAQKDRIDGRIADGMTSPITPGTEDAEGLELVEMIYAEAKQRIADSEPEVVSYAGNQHFSGTETFGSSPTNPKIVYVNGNARFTGDVDGHGVLIVDGDLEIQGSSSNPDDNFAWEGLVFAQKAAEITYSQSGKTRIDGALILDSPVVDSVTASIDFTIDSGGTLTVNERFAARVEVLGAAISANGAYDMPVTISAEVGDDDFEPWGDVDKAVSGNINDDRNPRSFDVPDIYDAGSEVTVLAKAFNKKREWKKDWYWSYSCWCWRYQWVYNFAPGTHNGDWYEFRERQSGEDSDFVKVLRDGDAVPNIAGYLSQGSVASFVTDYIENGHVVLEPNQAIYLFELGTTNLNSSAADFQDAVVLLTLAKEIEVVAATPGGSSGTGGSGTISLSRVNFDLAGDARVQYSAEAIGRLAKRLGTVSSTATVKALRQRSYNPAGGFEAMSSGE